jgi:N-acetylglutamate synthase-like GNAT family acetyltransferase
MIQIRKARSWDREEIRRLYLSINSPHGLRININDYFVALVDGKIVGCAAIRRVRNGGYLYGRAVMKQWRRRGIGTALIARRLEWLRDHGVKTAASIVMFWNLSPFRKLGFRTMPRVDVPLHYKKLADFRNPRNRHCARLWIEL